ncbi:hypothetical protein HZ994_15490 [Akkermansiaceae bacterium]|nr:hypothetical protein HZ994_15490 [Akkermansiaceae bacterium]
MLTAIALATASIATHATAKEVVEIPLNGRGTALLGKYSGELESLRSSVLASVPAVEEAKKTRFQEARAKWNGLTQPNDETPPAERKALEELRDRTQAEGIEAASALLADLSPFLSSDALDSKLIRIAVLTHATPRGLAEFAQKGAAQEKLLETLFADEGLMRQVLEAGGANGGAYGEMMQVYSAILAKSERAREVGSIFQRLALGTAIHMPWQGGKPAAGVHGIVYRTQYDIDQVERYLHYEKAYLDGELDAAFPDFNTWECRFITDSEYSNEDLTWMRQMMRTYRPDQITTEDMKWRYVRIIKDDVPYCSTTHDPSIGSPAQEQIALGGICGRRAFLGRLSTRAFGIPTRASTQSGHAAMSRWTPDGWVVVLGAWWSQAWCGPQGGLDFLLDSQAREFGDEYQIVRRAQWIGDALGEDDVDIGHGKFGKGGGFWDGLAFVKKQLIVKKAEVEALELVGGMKLGESDELIGDEEGEDIEIPDADKEIKVADDGTIKIPAVACYSPRKSSDRVLFLKSWDEGYQLHYSRLGQRPELFKYNIEVPAEGEYELTAEVATVSLNLEVLVRANRDDPAPYAIPYTKGMWAESKPMRLKLSEGRNLISVTARTPNRGVSIRNWLLKPVK